MKRFISCILILCVGIAAFAIEKRYIAVESTSLRAKNSASSKSVGQVAYGDEVSLIKESGKWSLVSPAADSSIQGWISSSALSKRKIVAGGKKVSTDAKEISLAGKGFSEGLEAEYGKEGNADYNAVDAIEKNTVTEDERSTFVKEGKLKECE